MVQGCHWCLAAAGVDEAARGSQLEARERLGPGVRLPKRQLIIRLPKRLETRRARPAAVMYRYLTLHIRIVPLVPRASPGVDGVDAAAPRRHRRDAIGDSRGTLRLALPTDGARRPSRRD